MTVTEVAVNWLGTHVLQRDGDGLVIWNRAKGILEMAWMMMILSEGELEHDTSCPCCDWKEWGVFEDTGRSVLIVSLLLG